MSSNVLMTYCPECLGKGTGDYGQKDGSVIEEKCKFCKSEKVIPYEKAQESDSFDEIKGQPVWSFL